GNMAAVREGIARALAQAPGRDIKMLSALSLARAGEVPKAKSILEGLKKSESGNTYLKIYWFPVIEAALALAQHAPDQAVRALEPALPYEYGTPPPGIPTYPVYLRGVAYLQQKNGAAAAIEFQKFADHRGIVQNFLLGSLARLQLARAYAMSGDAAK